MNGQQLQSLLYGVPVTPRREVRDEVTPFEDDEDWDEEWYDEREPCSCPYCFCMNDTEYGEICGDCAAGSHQG